MVYKYEQLIPVIFGMGALQQLGEEINKLGAKKALLVIDGGVKAAGIGEKAEAVLKDAGIDYVIFDKIVSDPPTEIIDEGAIFAKEQGVDVVVGIGGGSSLDVAKSIGVLQKYEPPVKQHLELPPLFLDSPIPIILIPTTAGTGSEVTQVSVISDVEKNCKLAIFVRSTLAIVDPALTLTVPPAITAYTGLDALSHAVESVTALNWNPNSELLALSAIEKIGKFLPIACADGYNEEARTNLSLAANWAGIAFAATDIHFGHSIADGFSGAFHTPHGLNCAWATPEVVSILAKTMPDKIKLIGEALGVAFSGSEEPGEIGEITAAAIRKLMKDSGIKSLKDSGYSREDVMAIVPAVVSSGYLYNSPIEVNEAVATELVSGVYDNYQ